MPAAPRPPLRLGVLVSGQGTTLRALVEAIGSGRLPARIVLVATDRAEAPGAAFARVEGLPVRVLRTHDGAPGSWESILASALEESRAELVVLAGFLRVLRGPLLRRFEGRIINLHPSLLPKFSGPGMYGTRVHAAVLASGDPETGATVHLVTADVDRGPILGQGRWPVRPGETAEELSERQKPLEHQLVIDVVRRFADGELPLPYPVPSGGAPAP